MKKTFLDRVIKLGVKAAVGSLESQLPPKLRSKEMKNLVEREVEDWAKRNAGVAAQKVGKAVSENVKKVKQKVDELRRPTIDELKLQTACRVLGVPVPKKRKKVDLEKASAKRRELLKKHHPDKGGNREQFQAVTAAYELLEKYNSKL